MRELIYTPTVRLSLWDITDGLYLDENTFENWLSGHLTVKCESLQTSQQRSMIEPQHILTKLGLQLRMIIKQQTRVAFYTIFTILAEI